MLLCAMYSVLRKHLWQYLGTNPVKKGTKCKSKMRRDNSCSVLEELITLQLTLGKSLASSPT